MPKCDFNKVAKQLRHGCSPVNLKHIFRTPFQQNTSGWLLLGFANILKLLSKVSNIQRIQLFKNRGRLLSLSI